MGINISKLIQESLEKTFENSPRQSDITESFLSSVVADIQENINDVNKDIIISTFPEIFENEDLVSKFNEMLVKNNIDIPGITSDSQIVPDVNKLATNSSRQFNESELSTTIGLITSGMEVNLYLNRSH